MLSLSPATVSRRARLSSLRRLSSSSSSSSYSTRSNLDNNAPTTTTSAAAASTLTNLAGTAPPHALYVLLRTPTRPRALAESRPASSTRAALQRHPALASAGALVNLAYVDEADFGEAWAGSGGHRANASEETTAESEADLPSERGEEEVVVDGVAFAAGRRAPLRLRRLSLDDACDALTRFAKHRGPDSHVGSRLEEEGDAREYSESAEQEQGALHLYVCTHGARDCRCGEHGAALANALVREVQVRARRERGDGRSKSEWSRTVVGEVTHVGGHQHAANLLVFPYGEWLGGLRASDAPTILDALAAYKAGGNYRSRAPLLRQHWRGRMGLTPDEQRTLFQNTNG